MFKNTFCFRSICLFVLLLINSFYGHSQKHEADSIVQLLSVAKEDSNKVKLLTDFANIIYLKNPDTALIISLEALALADRINYDKDNYKYLWLLTVIAKTYSKIGNYPLALKIDFKILEIEEKRKTKHVEDLSTVLMSIGLVYHNMGDYRNALVYLYKSDSIIKKNDITYLKYYSFVNIADVYDNLDLLDSASHYTSKARIEADSLNNNYLIGASQLVLAHIYRKQSKFQLSRESYTSAINFLKSKDEELFCEALLGLGYLYDSLNQSERAIFYADSSMRLAKKDGFPSQQLDAATFLRQVYSKKNKFDKAYAYAMIEKELNDTLNSANKIRELQIIASNEVTRQIEMAEKKKQAEKEWKNRLQQLLIGIFIPGLFLITLLLSKVNLHIRVIRFLGVFSLLFFFEYLTLFMHPTVARLTNHTPVYEILIFVVIAAILIPMHHRTEHWLIHKLLHRRIQQPDNITIGDSKKST